MVTVRTDDTVTVLMLNVAVVWPAGMVTPITGTMAIGSLLRNDTLAPPEGAWVASVTAPVTVTPPGTVFVLSVIATGGLIVNRADCVVPLSVAEIVADCGLVTADVVISKVTDL